jgi:hypothetical protein
MIVQHAARRQVQSTTGLGVASWCRVRHLEISRHEKFHFETGAATAGRSVPIPPYWPEKT